MKVITDTQNGISFSVIGKATFEDWPTAYVSLEECFLYETACGCDFLNYLKTSSLGEKDIQLY